MEHTCKYCEKSKSASEMAIRGGKISKQCLECKQSRASLGAGAPKKKKAKPDRLRAKLAELLEFEVTAGGHGFKASVTDEDTLLITQANDGSDDDNVVLTRHEAKQLFDIFGQWIVAT